MKDFASLIKERRSTRKFTSQLLNPDQVAAILKAGLMAPASKRKNLPCGFDQLGRGGRRCRFSDRMARNDGAGQHFAGGGTLQPRGKAKRGAEHRACF